MNTVVSYLHLLACIGWTIFVVVMTLDNSRGMLEGSSLVATITLLLLTSSGIYLFATGQNRELSKLQKLKVENAILEKQVEQVKLRKQLESTGNANKA